ncbi:MAG: DUF4433 domain-containing protein [Selenomonadaceae bacterium]|nr:DUF4433 domain-containing protein [Selenomonadaceae bacterium]
MNWKSLTNFFSDIWDKFKNLFIDTPKQPENIFVALAKFRGIKFLVHFTKIENLPSIAKFGLLTRKNLDDKSLNYSYNDDTRRDNITNSLSLSITFPNYKMFYKYSGASEDWAVILLDAEKILGNIPCAFNYTNASNDNVKKISKEKRMSVDAFQKMFYEPDDSSRKMRNLNANEPTDPQAEILCLGDIPLKYFAGIVFKNSSRATENKKLFSNIPLKVDDYYFAPRHDYKFWQVNFNEVTVMANRPVYVAKHSAPFVEIIHTDFKFYNGFSDKQKRLSIKSLHSAFLESYPEKNILEISSKSENPLGVKLGAFDLKISRADFEKDFSVESAFQGSKVFENGGPYVDLLNKTSREAKTDERIKTSGKLIGFKYFNEAFPLEPTTYFYDWLYINALNLNPDLAEEILKFNAFTDIEFNPKKSLNCQAKAAAIFVGLNQANLIIYALKCKENFLKIVYPKEDL